MNYTNTMRSNDIDALEYPDDIILKKCYAGEATGWDMLVEKYYKLIYNKIHNTLYIINGDNSSNYVDDIYQDVFVKLLKYFNAKNKIEHLKAFIVRLTYTTTIDYIREHFKENKMCLPEDDDSMNTVEDDNKYIPEQIVISKEIKEKINAAILELSPNEQIILKLFYFYGKKYEDIAEILQTTSGSIGGLKSNAEKKLYKLLTNKQKITADSVEFAVLAFLLLQKYFN